MVIVIGKKGKEKNGWVDCRIGKVGRINVIEKVRFKLML